MKTNQFDCSELVQILGVKPHVPNLIILPKQRASLAIPWRGDKSANYEWLREICGTRTKPRYDRICKRFTVARTHTAHVLSELIIEYGRVFIVHCGYKSTTCVAACWDANPDSVIDCECGCAGLNHGSGAPMGFEMKNGLSVHHEYVVSKYYITSKGHESLR